MKGYLPGGELKTITVNGKEYQYYVHIKRGNDQEALRRFQLKIGELADYVEQKLAEKQKEGNLNEG